MLKWYRELLKQKKTVQKFGGLYEKFYLCIIIIKLKEISMKKSYSRILFFMMFVCLALTAQASKRLQSISYKGDVYSFSYDNDGHVIVTDCDIQGGKVVSYGSYAFAYEGDRLVGIDLWNEHYELIWNDDLVTDYKTYIKGKLFYESQGTYSDECPNAAIATAINFIALHFADPEEIDPVAMLYSVSPYIGKLTNKLIGRVTAIEDIDDPEKDEYDCIYTYTKDDEGYITVVDIDVTKISWKSSSPKEHHKNRQILLTWEDDPTSISDVKADHKSNTVWTVDGMNTGYTSDDFGKLPKGVYIIAGKKSIKL